TPNKKAKTVYNISEEASYDSLELLKSGNFSLLPVDFSIMSFMNINTTSVKNSQITIISPAPTNKTNVENSKIISTSKLKPILLAGVHKTTEITQSMALDINAKQNKMDIDSNTIIKSDSLLKLYSRAHSLAKKKSRDPND
ncbi:18691_t:CDS:2, partial [Gigaspora margarita]